jgi:hypothetical protein
MTTLNAPYTENLSGAQRNYRKPGAKLKPRCAHTAYEAEWRKVSARALRKELAQEYAHNERVHGGGEIDGWWKRYHKEFDKLNTRSKKLVELAVYEEQPAPYGAQRARAYNAMQNAMVAERCMEIDRKMLANAY